jgi:hypothetical protein
MLKSQARLKKIQALEFVHKPLVLERQDTVSSSSTASVPVNERYIKNGAQKTVFFHQKW